MKRLLCFSRASSYWLCSVYFDLPDLAAIVASCFAWTLLTIILSDYWNRYLINTKWLLLDSKVSIIFKSLVYNFIWNLFVSAGDEVYNGTHVELSEAEKEVIREELKKVSFYWVTFIKIPWKFLKPKGMGEFEIDIWNLVSELCVLKFNRDIRVDTWNWYCRNFRNRYMKSILSKSSPHVNLRDLWEFLLKWFINDIFF